MNNNQVEVLQAYLIKYVRIHCQLIHKMCDCFQVAMFVSTEL